MHEPIPLIVAIELMTHHDDDRMEHLLSIRVAGSDETLSAEIESDFHEWPRIKFLISDGGLELPERLRDQFIFMFFELSYPALDGVDMAEWRPLDTNRLIQIRFLTDEAELLLDELRKQVTPGLIANASHSISMIPFYGPHNRGKQP